METPNNFEVSEEQNAIQNSITDFVELVACIMDYYNSEGKRVDSEEKWKENSKYDHKTIPDNIDEMVESAFVTQLKKFS